MEKYNVINHSIALKTAKFFTHDIYFFRWAPAHWKGQVFSLDLLRATMLRTNISATK